MVVRSTCFICGESGPNEHGLFSYPAYLPKTWWHVDCMVRRHEELCGLLTEAVEDEQSFINQEIGYCEKCDGRWDYDMSTYAHTPECLVTRARAALERITKSVLHR